MRTGMLSAYLNRAKEFSDSPYVSHVLLSTVGIRPNEKGAHVVAVSNWLGGILSERNILQACGHGGAVVVRHGEEWTVDQSW